jgi:hypothetical protein
VLQFYSEEEKNIGRVIPLERATAWVAKAVGKSEQKVEKHTKERGKYTRNWGKCFNAPKNST